MGKVLLSATLGSILLVSLLMAGEAHAGSARYSLVPLGYFPGGAVESGAYGINDQGCVVGTAKLPNGNPHGYLWQNGTKQDLGSMGGSNLSEAYAINDANQVTGWTTGNWGVNEHAFRRDGSSMRDLATLYGYTSTGRGINNAGHVVGWSSNSSGSQRAFLWKEGVMTNLGTFGGSNSFAYGINDTGQIVGWAETTAAKPHAFAWQAGVMTDIGGLPGYSQWPSKAYGNNSNGDVVGGCNGHAFLWRSGVMQDLGTFGGGNSSGYDVNDHGQVVGYSTISLQPSRAFLWEAGSGMVDLIHLVDESGDGWALLEAVSINNSGQIVGTGYNPGGAREAFLLMPVPEPSGLLCLATGLAVLTSTLRRRR